MYNDLFSVGPITIHTYGLMIAIGIITALFTGEARAKKQGLDGDALYPMTLICVVGGFFCAKILFCIVEWEQFLKNPAKILSGSGFVVYGGIIGGILFAYLYFRYKKYRFVDYFDLVLPCVAIAQGFGRIGCFFAGCCYGRETTSKIGIIFTHSDYAPNNVRLLPTQLFSAAGMFLIAFILSQYAKSKPRTGRVGALYLILYSIGRFGIEFLRNDHRGEIGIFSTSQFISLFIAVVGLVIFFGNFWDGHPQQKEKET